MWEAKAAKDVECVVGLESHIMRIIIPQTLADSIYRSSAIHRIFITVKSNLLRIF